MGRVTVSEVIQAPPEEIFDLVADLSARPAFADHYLKDFRLARANPRGLGAAARFLFDRPFFNDRAEIAITEAERPRRIVEEGGIGRRGRSRLTSVYEFTSEPGGETRVELTTAVEATTGVDRARLRGLDRWLRRHSKKALERLRRIFEQLPDGALERVRVAGHEPHTAPRFGAHVTPPGGAAADRG